ncbi:MAG: hypothetical protein E7574_02180 [Ruminococcaceae bacterium]|nr:hypothetical protein [Oscillospiraceae bacterium]
MDNKLKIKIGLPTFIFFAVLLTSNVKILSFLPFFAALLHEFGHIFAMKLCGEKILAVKILPFGIDIKKAPSLTSYKADIFVCIAGILTNILLILLCSAMPKNIYTEFFIMSNYLLIFVNILPIKTLDGGQLLEKILLLKYDIQAAEKMLGITSFICILLLGSTAIWLLLSSSYNFTLLIMCMYLFCGIFLK